jgi:hypothetical protein
VIFADIDLARRLEEAESKIGEQCAWFHGGLSPTAKVAVAPFAGGRAVFAGLGSPMSEAKGLGLHGPVSDAELDRLTCFYLERGAAARVVVCPVADPSLVDGLWLRGYRPTEFENFLYLPLEAEEPPVASPGLRARRAEPSEAKLYAQVVAPNFFDSEQLTDEMLALFQSAFEMEGATAFLGLVDEQAAGGAGLFLYQNVALMAGAATLPPFRRRGLHALLSRTRREFARAAGCDLAIQGARPGSTSQRNAERQGFRVAYTRVTFVFEP